MDIRQTLERRLHHKPSVFLAIALAIVSVGVTETAIDLTYLISQREAGQPCGQPKHRRYVPGLKKNQKKRCHGCFVVPRKNRWP